MKERVAVRFGGKEVILYKDNKLTTVSAVTLKMPEGVASSY